MLVPAAVALALSSASASPVSSPPAAAVTAQAQAQAQVPAVAAAEAPAASQSATAPVPAASLAADDVLHAPAATTLALGSTAIARDTPGAETRADTAPELGSDPFEGFNRKFFQFSQHLDRTIVGPVARTYKRKAPGTAQRMLHNFVTNFGEPVVLANDILQLRPKRALTTAFRFIVNTTAGIGGLFDPARQAGAEHHDNDFGITLGRYGAPPGPYMWIPLLGPSSVRDALGSAVDGFVIDPLAWAGWVKELEPAHPPQHPHPYFHHHDAIPNRDTIRIGEGLLSGIDTRARVDEEMTELMSTATDPYATLRSVYMQNRAALVREAQWKHSDLPDFDTPADTSSAPPAEGAAATPASAAVAAAPAAAPAVQAEAPAAPAPPATLKR